MSHPRGGAKLRSICFVFRDTIAKTSASFARPPGRGRPGLRGSCGSQCEGYNYVPWLLRPNYLMKPASVLLESTPEQLPKGPPSPAFLVDLPAWHTVFFRNLADLFRPEKQAQFKPSSAPGSFWPDVFVVSGAPWSRFALSLLGHVAAIAAIFGLVQLWPQKPEVVVSRVFNRNDVVYYAPSEYLPPLDTGGAKKPLPQRGEPAFAPQPIISVPPEADNRSHTIVTPSDVKLNHDVPLPNIVAWSQTQAQPAMPLASTTAAAQNLRLPTLSVAVVAPTPETIPTERQRSAPLSQAVVAPAQDVNVESSARTLQAPQAAVVAPTPQVDSTSARRLGDINIGHSAVVAPSPELPVAEQYASRTSGQAQSALGSAGPAVVPPPPSIAGSTGSNSGGRLISLGIHPAAVAPAEPPGGNRRGNFAATPTGKVGGAGTPDVATNADSGSGSASGVNKNTGVPTGLTVGAAPDGHTTSSIGGQGQGSGTGGGNALSHSPDGSRQIADATPPRVTSTSPPASEVSRDRATACGPLDLR